MSNTNYFSGIVKILEDPQKLLINKNISIITFHAEVPQNRVNKIISLVFWGKLVSEIESSYQKHDYILIEGYLSVRRKKLLSYKINNSQKTTLTVLKIYPLLLK